MILKKRNKFKIITGLLLCANGAFGQYNVDYNTGPYKDEAVLTSVTEVGDNHVISVGTISRNDFGISNEDIILTKTDGSGNVVWNYRYGQIDQDETGHGITLSWDAMHVIVVGSVTQNNLSAELAALPVRDAVTMKIRISDGAVIWTTKHGTLANDEEGLLIERVNDGAIVSKAYVVVGRSTGDASQSYGRMYAFKLNESGGEVWSRRYLLSDNFPINSINPMSMVLNGKGKLMIAGTQDEINRPTTIFTTGISTLNGGVQDIFVEYSVNNVSNVKECAIAKDADGSGFGLVFTAEDFSGACYVIGTDAVSSSVDRIGVMRLGSDRRVNWTNVYWQPNTQGQRAVAIDIKKGVYNIATSYNIYDGFVNRIGFLSVNKVNGVVINRRTYLNAMNTYGATIDCMIPTKDGGYVLKAFVDNNGFTLIKTNDIGASNCAEINRIVRCATTVSGTRKKSTPIVYGTAGFGYAVRKSVSHYSEGCSDVSNTKDSYGTNRLCGETDHVVRTEMVMYPTLLRSNQREVNIHIGTEMEEMSVEMMVYNTAGKIVLKESSMLYEGENIIDLQVGELPAGMFILVMMQGEEVLGRAKFVKQ